MPMRKFPNEILIQIFLRHNALYSASEGVPRYAYACDGAKLMLVCRHWRDLAVSTPYLWQATMVRHNTEFFKLVLSRSQNLPLDLVFHPSTSIYGIVTSIVLLIPHLHRLRSIFIPAVDIWRRAPVQAIFGLGMPFLSDLEVLAQSNGPLPVDLSPQRLPALRALRLSSCAIPWVPTMLPKLRCLDLQECTCGDSSLTFEQLLGVLSECVELHELRLHNFFSALRGPSTAARENPPFAICFPHLRTLSVEDTPNFLSNFLSYVRLPPDTNIRIVSHIPDVTVDIASAFLSLLPQDTSGLPILQMVTFGEIESWHASCELAGHVGWPHGGPSITLGLHPGDLSTWSFYLENALHEFSTIFSRAPVDRLNICGEYDRVRYFDTWVRLFTAFPAIQHLALEGKDSPISMIWAIGQPPYDEDAQTPGPPVAETDNGLDDLDASGALVLPNLRSLSLDSVEWSPGLIETMVMVLRHRIETGLPKLEDLILYPTEDGDHRGFSRTMTVYRRQLESLVDRLDDSLKDS